MLKRFWNKNLFGLRRLTTLNTKPNHVNTVYICDFRIADCFCEQWQMSSCVSLVAFKVSYRCSSETFLALFCDLFEPTLKDFERQNPLTEEVIYIANVVVNICLRHTVLCYWVKIFHLNYILRQVICFS